MADIFSSWTDETVRAVENLILRALSTYTLLQAGIFLCVALIVALPAFRRRLTPRFFKRHRVRQMARHHFAASGARLSHAEPHILIYASLSDRQVELVAHRAIHRGGGRRALECGGDGGDGGHEDRTSPPMALSAPSKFAETLWPGISRPVARRKITCPMTFWKAAAAIFDWFETRDRRIRCSRSCRKRSQFEMNA